GRRALDAGGIERKRIASAGTAARGAAGRAGIYRARNQPEDKDDRRLLARSALQRTNIIQAAKLYLDRRADTGVGDWRQHGDFQCGERPAATLSAFRRPGEADMDRWLGAQR